MVLNLVYAEYLRMNGGILNLSLHRVGNVQRWYLMLVTARINEGTAHAIYGRLQKALLRS
jgi:hypothetical protein